VGVRQIFASRILLEVIGATAAFSIMVLVFSVVELMPAPKDLLPIMSGWALLAWFGAALGLFLGAASELSEMVDRIWHPVSYLLFPLSGAMFMVDWLPSNVQELALWVPMLSAIELIRSGYFGELIKAHYDLTWLISVNLGLTLSGLYLCQAVEARVENE
jgi:capsular polysaccharide transport system permease protein